MSRGLLALVLSSIVVAAVQVSVVSPLRIGGVVIVLVWLWALALGLTSRTGPAVAGAMLGGLLFDAYLATPFGLNALVAGALAALASLLAREGIGDLDASAWWMPPALGLVAGISAPILLLAAGLLYANTALWHGAVIMTMVVNAAMFFLFTRPVARVARAVAAVGGWARA